MIHDHRSKLSMGKREFVAQLRAPHAATGRTPVDELAAETAAARLDNGLWIVDCPYCPGAAMVDWNEPITFCLGCHNEMAGHRWSSVILPTQEERDAIELALTTGEYSISYKGTAYLVTSVSMEAAFASWVEEMGGAYTPADPENPNDPNHVRLSVIWTLPEAAQNWRPGQTIEDLRTGRAPEAEGPSPEWWQKIGESAAAQRDASEAHRAEIEAVLIAERRAILAMGREIEYWRGRHAATEAVLAAAREHASPDGEHSHVPPVRFTPRDN